MTVTAASFKTLFPEFCSVDEPQITMWIPIMSKMVNEARWAELTDYGISLAIAHQMALNARQQGIAKRGGVPGATGGVLNSKSVDEVSASYDVSSTTEENAGHWNLTIYGTQYIRMLRMMGAGPIQVGVDAGDGNGTASGAWPGVIY